MTARAPIRILLVEDHALVREGTAAIVDAQEDLEVVGMAADADGAVQRAHELAPDVVLLDFRIPGGGPEVARRIAHVAPAARVLVVSAYGQPDYVASMRQVGVAGYLLKSATPNALVKAIRRVHGGATVFDDVAGAARPSAAGLRGTGSGIEPLTMRELDVLRLVAQGGSNREIADALGVSTKTVEAHLSSVYAKLGVRSRTEAVVKSARAGIISVEFFPEPV